jgi:hypothetical protein
VADSVGAGWTAGFAVVAKGEHAVQASPTARAASTERSPECFRVTRRG